MGERAHMNGKTILLVEDEAIIAMNEARLLKKYGCQVITAYSGQQALEALAGPPPTDLVLMDIDLGKGKMDGAQAAELILQQYDLPLIFLSGHTEREVVEKTEAITSYGYIVKDSNETVMIALIKMAFRLFESRQREKEKDLALLRLEQEALQRFETLFRNSPAPMTFSTLPDPQRRYVDVNQAFLDLTGYDRDEVIGKSPYDLQIYSDMSRMAAIERRIMDEKQVFNLDLTIRHKGGRLIPGLVSAELVSLQGQVYILATLIDITPK
jgi:PAS domain S-box-containing protein